MTAVRIATWNVNSLRSRIDRVEALLDRHEIDVLALQETKAREEQLPLMGLQARGYDVAAAGTNQWNGVAIISRVGLEDVERGFPGQPGWAKEMGAPPSRSRARSAPPAAAYGSGRSTCPTAASPTTRTTSTSWTGTPRSARRRGTGWAATPCWSATGTSAPPTTTSST